MGILMVDVVKQYLLGKKVMDKNVTCGIFLQNGKNWKF